QHAAYYLALSKAEAPNVETRMRHIDREYDNLWSAFAWSQTSAADPNIMSGLAGSLIWFWVNRGMRREAVEAVERTLAHPRASRCTATHAWLRSVLAENVAQLGNYTAAQQHFDQALAQARELGDRRLSAFIQGSIGWLARERGDGATAWARLSESVAILRELGDEETVAGQLGTMAEVAILE